jgi:hypothetical protein
MERPTVPLPKQVGRRFPSLPTTGLRPWGVGALARTLAETTLADVVRSTGPLWQPMRVRTRYSVMAIAGFRIEPDTRKTGSKPHGCTWAVLDSADCFHAVGIFGDRAGEWSPRAQKKAQALCDKLNAEERRAA